MNHVKVLIVDDEEPARRLLNEYLSEIDGYQLVGGVAMVLKL